MITSFYQNRNLLFQFYLNEFLAARTEIARWQNARKPHFSQLKASFCLLAGPCQEPFHYSPWNPEVGILLKLKHFSFTFAASAAPHETKDLQLEQTASRLWKLGLDISYTISQAEKQVNASSSPLLDKEISNFIKSFHRLCELTTLFIKDFAKDENIVFYVLKNKDSFDAIYGTAYVKTLMAESHPDGIGQAASFLKNRFLQRGFENAAKQFATKCLELV